MADINNPQAVLFTNQMARPLADSLETAYRTAVKVVEDWNAQNMAALIPNDAAAQIFDGAESDGRPIAHGADVVNIITRAMELMADYEANGLAKLNTVLAISVNGQSRV
jgi:hypothetical protein